MLLLRILLLLLSFMPLCADKGFDLLEDDEGYYEYDYEADYEEAYLDYRGVVADVTNAADAEFTHERALAAANQGNLQEALPLFKRAAELNPEKDTFWSNYGVTQMRLNLLDEALVSYTKGLRLNPSSDLIKENMKALKRKWRCGISSVLHALLPFSLRSPPPPRVCANLSLL